MRAVGIIAEYNPFHNGHYYHLNQSKKAANADVVVCVMSGDFVQRGEPAIIDKFSRTQMALQGGADLVVMLPFAYSCQSAEIFAYGSVHLVNKLACSTISFGCEDDDTEKLHRAAKILTEENAHFHSSLKKHLSLGRSFAKSRQLAVEEIDPQAANLLSSPNNILAVEYMKQILLHNYPITPIAIKRCGSNHNTRQTNNFIASASFIREELHNGLINIKKYIPSFVYEALLHQTFNDMENYRDILYQNLLITTAEHLCSFPDISPGLANKFLNNLKDFISLSDYSELLYDKHHARSRISRSFCHILTNFNISYDVLKDNPVPYIRILGFNETGREYLHLIKGKEQFVSNTYNYYIHAQGYAKKIFSYDLTASDIFQLGLNKHKGIDYKQTPIYYK
jgi:predicted nucleotidyltransferase